jgi:uncharacterized protein (DUF1330 family)
MMHWLSPVSYDEGRRAVSPPTRLRFASARQAGRQLHHQRARKKNQMKGYIIVEIDVTDPVGYEDYKRLAGATVAKYDGKYLVRGGPVQTLEGGWKPQRIVVLEFPSVARAKEWIECAEYREPRKVRHRTARTNMILLEGA